MMKQLRDIVGAKNVLDDEQTLALYSTDQTLNPKKRPCAVVKPKNTAEVQELVKWANTTLTPLVPASSGVHFTGGTLPAQGGVIVDMSGMNKILEIDSLNRKAKIEPGVTWQQLNEALKEHDQMALNPLFPHPQASALTSSVEREPMLIPKYEYGEPALTMEVVLPTGDLFITGSASDSHCEGAYPEGPGIDFWRLFLGAQGTMGIITWLNVKTEYRPKQQKAF
ncbi:MAG: FAD-binding oxidoreductase, partial [Deltaproteobacteria bacterium]|nr:FAD-binding oxidoreductase [Deltaproteobacteria bacterium]